jgi:hypothetical protein
LLSRLRDIGLGYLSDERDRAERDEAKQRNDPDRETESVVEDEGQREAKSACSTRERPRPRTARAPLLLARRLLEGVRSVANKASITFDQRLAIVG